MEINNNNKIPKRNAEIEGKWLEMGEGGGKKEE